MKLLRLLEAGSFRQDLYRLSTFPIFRERREDLAMLVENLLQRLSPDKPMRLAPDAMEWLARYDFPGNIRELRNILERGVTLADGDVIQPDHLPQATAVDMDRVEGAILPLDEMERRYLERTLARLGGDKDALAQRMGISRRTINRKQQATH